MHMRSLLRGLPVFATKLRRDRYLRRRYLAKTDRHLRHSQRFTDVSRTITFPDKTFTGQTFPGQVILRNFHVASVCKYQLKA